MVEQTIVQIRMYGRMSQETFQQRSQVFSGIQTQDGITIALERLDRVSMLLYSSARSVHLILLQVRL